VLRRQRKTCSKQTNTAGRSCTPALRAARRRDSTDHMLRGQRQTCRDLVTADIIPAKSSPQMPDVQLRKLSTLLLSAAGPCVGQPVQCETAVLLQSVGQSCKRVCLPSAHQSINPQKLRHRWSLTAAGPCEGQPAERLQALRCHLVLLEAPLHPVHTLQRTLLTYTVC
jgi:hypothetical protein